MAKRGRRGEGADWDEGEGFGGGEDQEGKRRKKTPRKKEKSPEWRPFAESPVLKSLQKAIVGAGEAAPPFPVGGERKEEPAAAEAKAEATPPLGAPPEKPSEAKPEAPPKEKKPRGPRPKKETTRETEGEKARREWEEKVAAIYQDLKKSGKTQGEILKYMREYRAYPGYARFVAGQKLLEEIKAGKIIPEMAEQFKKAILEQKRTTKIKARDPRTMKFTGKEFEVVVGGKEPSAVEIDKLELGPAKLVEGMKEGEAYQEGARWSKQEWYNFLLRQYLAHPEYAKKKIESYLGKHKDENKKYSPEIYEAHERLLTEMEGRELGEKFRAREERAEGKEKRKLSEKDIEEILLGFEEYLEQMPGQEGKAISERLREVQMSEVESMLGENISWDDIHERAIEILSKGKANPDEVRAKVEELIKAKAAARKTGGEMKIIRKKAGAPKKEIKVALGVKEEKAEGGKKTEEAAKFEAEFEKAEVAAENELITEAARKFFALREIVVHHTGGWDPKRGFRAGFYSDLDGKGAVALFAKAGIDIKKGSYVPAGYRRKGAENIDTGLADGIFWDEEEITDPETGEKKTVETWFSDHHGILSDRGTSATKDRFEIFSRFGLLKFESEAEKRAWEKTVEFVTQMDNFTFPGVKGGEFYRTSEGLVNGKHVYDTSNRRLVGYAAWMPFDKVLQFFIDQEQKPKHLRKTPVDELSDGELARYGLYRGRVEDKGKKIKEAIKVLDEVIKDGGIITTKGGKRFVIDWGGKMGREGQWAAGSRGFDGILRFNPEGHGFTVALNEGTFDESTQELLKSLPQGILIRGTLFIKPAAEKAKIGREEEMSERTKEMVERVKGDLLVTLGDLVESITDPKNKGENGRKVEDFLKKIENKLLAEKTRLEKELAELIERSPRDMTLERTLESALRDVNDALERIKEEIKGERLIKTSIFKIVEREIISEIVVTGEDTGKDTAKGTKNIRANWWATTKDGTPILVENAPRDLVSGEEGLIRLKDKTKAILRGENIEKFGLEWSGDGKEEKEVDFWFGEWQKTKFPEPTAEERRVEEEKRKTAELIGEEMDVLRRRMDVDPTYAEISERAREKYLEELGDQLEKRLGPKS